MRKLRLKEFLRSIFLVVSLFNPFSLPFVLEWNLTSWTAYNILRNLVLTRLLVHPLLMPDPITSPSCSLSTSQTPLLQVLCTLYFFCLGLTSPSCFAKIIPISEVEYHLTRNGFPIRYQKSCWKQDPLAGGKIGAKGRKRVYYFAPGNLLVTEPREQKSKQLSINIRIWYKFPESVLGRPAPSLRN